MATYPSSHYLRWARGRLQRSMLAALLAAGCLSGAAQAAPDDSILGLIPADALGVDALETLLGDVGALLPLGLLRTAPAPHAALPTDQLTALASDGPLAEQTLLALLDLAQLADLPQPQAGGIGPSRLLPLVSLDDINITGGLRLTTPASEFGLRLASLRFIPVLGGIFVTPPDPTQLVTAPEPSFAVGDLDGDGLREDQDAPLPVSLLPRDPLAAPAPSQVSLEQLTAAPVLPLDGDIKPVVVDNN